MSNEINEIINTNIDRNIIMENVSRCVFCHERHNVRDCNDERLLEFEVICTTVFHHVRNIGEFILWLYSYLDANTFAVRLKAFTIRSCGCSEYTTIDQCVNMLCLYMDNTYTMGHHEGNEEVEAIRETMVRLEEIGREHIARESVARESVARESVAREADTRESDTRESAARESAARESAARESDTRESAAREWLAREWFAREADTEVEKIRYQIIKPLPIKGDTRICLCSICWEEKEETKFVNYLCSHEFCNECVLSTFKTKPVRNKLKCALCRGHVDLITIHSDETHNLLKDYLQ